MKRSGNTILVTGGTSGIGRALAQALHDNRNRVIVAGRRQALLDDATAGRARTVGMWLDLDDLPSLHGFADDARARFPELTVLIAHAGISSREDLTGLRDLTAAEAMIETNILGTLRVIGALLPDLRRDRARRSWSRRRTSPSSRVPSFRPIARPRRSCAPGSNRCAISSATFPSRCWNWRGPMFGPS